MWPLRDFIVWSKNNWNATSARFEKKTLSRARRTRGTRGRTGGFKRYCCSCERAGPLRTTCSRGDNRFLHSPTGMMATRRRLGQPLLTADSLHRPWLSSFNIRDYLNGTVAFRKWLYGRSTATEKDKQKRRPRYIILHHCPLSLSVYSSKTP